MAEQEKFTYEIVLARLWNARFISHLDIMRALSRTLRRSHLPIYFTEGFNPKPKLSYRTPALSLGHTSQCERIRFQLMKNLPAEDIEKAMSPEMPPGLSTVSVTQESSLKGKGAIGGYIFYVFVPNTLDIEMPPENILAENGMTPATPEEYFKVTLLEDPDENRRLIEENFKTILKANVGFGNDYRNPVKTLASLTEEPDKSKMLCCHRFCELPA